MSHVNEPIDLRSDTVTKPSEAMRRAMAAAPVGDDVYREDPTVNRLQETVAGMLGKEAALFVPSGTMSNQLCLRTLTRVGDEVIVHEDAHVLHYEAGSAAALSGLQLRPVAGALGVLAAAEVEKVIRPASEHFPRTGAVEMENTHNRCGGTIWPLEAMEAVAAVAWAHGLAVHLDGARLWNAHKSTGVPLRAYAATADSVSVCFSKGLGAPVGSALAGTREFVEEARHNRKRYGGAMRQAGIIAAGALYALENNLDRLVEDHENAALLAGYLRQVPGVELIHPVQTNILIAAVEGLGVGAAQVVGALEEEGVLCGVATAGRIRFVTHLDVGTQAVKAAGEILVRVLSGLSRAARPDGHADRAAAAGSAAGTGTSAGSGPAAADTAEGAGS
ncbi:MAG: aminotransferase class I/II-fold pyridoxal phosphate-dependent enzyme [Actinomycetia bacterium]|nr:aminotransferase class I/II-fold pyridoxal phosphate-dependent enzyme [Actinomycetes bacterium]